MSLEDMQPNRQPDIEWSNLSFSERLTSMGSRVLCRLVLALGMIGWDGRVPAAELPPQVGAFFAAHCVSCHDAQTKKGGLDLAALPPAFDDPATVARWVRLYDRVKAGEMPPASRPRPPQTETGLALQAVADTLNAAEAARRTRDGRSNVRRLNRIEFENTLRDLLDLPWLEVKDLLPDDGRDQGYTKSAAALDVSPILMAKLGEAIDKALDAATAKWAVPPEAEHRILYANQQYDFKILMGGGDAIMLTKDMKYDESRFPMPSATNADGPYPKGKWSYGGMYKGLGEAEKAGVFKEPSTVGMTRTFGESFGGRFNFAPLHPGRYRIGVSAWSYWWDKGEVKPAPRTGAIGVYVGSRVVGFFDAPSLKPTWSEDTIDLEPKPGNTLRAAGASFLDAHVYFSQGQIKGYTGPGVAIDRLVIDGPLYDEWPPNSHRILFGTLPVVSYPKLPSGHPRPVRELPRQRTIGANNSPGRLVPGTAVSDDPPGDARRLLAKFLPRAFRRPVEPAEVERYAAVFDARLKDGVCFEDALKLAYRTALLSPDFLFLSEPVGSLDGYALASRLSYFLWNSMPDEALTTAARAGTLTEPATLKQQTERMLADPKAGRFVQDFLDQWLDLRDFDSTSPDRRLYPEYNPHLEDAIRREPSEFFQFALRRNLRVAELYHTGINMVNQRLAEHYGFSGVEGTRFRQKDVNANTVPRGGLLTMAATMKVTANGTTTTPVKRGAWVNRKVLGTPPQPPPADVPAVEPDVTGATTIREQLARHRNNAVCAACHARIDPPGFALESYDVIGGLRESYRATESKKATDFVKRYPGLLGPEGKFGSHTHFGYRDGPTVDASGELATGEAFNGLLTYRKLLVSTPPRQRQLARNLVNQLVLYSTGAPVGFADRAAVERILDEAGGNNPGVRALIESAIRSPLFQNK